MDGNTSCGSKAIFHGMREIVLAIQSHRIKSDGRVDLRSTLGTSCTCTKRTPINIDIPVMAATTKVSFRFLIVLYFDGESLRASSFDDARDTFVGDQTTVFDRARFLLRQLIVFTVADCKSGYLTLTVQ